ncbi:MAG: hypothetical protein QNK23_17240 [Crocinitomicaceae bacterium]|nr:hypothetical protein [Crocinitomicaceae bacterium]
MRYCIIFLTIILSGLCFGQDSATFSGNMSERKHRIAVARQSISELKDGVLLVRLDFQKKRIDYYTQYDNLREAEKIEAKQTKMNREIIDAFNTHFDFCQIVYFAQEDSRKLLNGDLDSIVFYNNNYEQDPTIDIGDKKWLVAEFGFIEQDITTYYGGTSHFPFNEEPSVLANEYGEKKNNISALVIRNIKFQQMRDPFPYYASYNFFGLVKKRYRIPVKKLNDRLHRYFSSNHISGE